MSSGQALLERLLPLFYCQVPLKERSGCSECVLVDFSASKSKVSVFKTRAIQYFQVYQSLKAK